MTNIGSLYKIFLSSSGITTDSRQAGKNMIFFALKGENHNGNLFAKQAIEKGCLCAVVDEAVPGGGAKTFLVDNALKALQELANYHRTKLEIPVLGLTGSNGKTTTKELITAVLSRKYKTLSTIGNLNNHIGVPLSILSIRDHEMAVIEMGANHPGEIMELCQIARPDYGLITNIGKAHLEGFGSFEGVIKTKKELYDFVDDVHGTLFVNYSNPLLKSLADKTRARKIIYGNDQASVCRGKVPGKNILLDIDLSWKFGDNKGHKTLQTKITGAYNLENVLAAFSVGLFFNVDINNIHEAICDYLPDNNRSQIIYKGSNTLILDAYNANPSSMMDALKNFQSFQHEKKLAILGDMRELGYFSSEEHLNILKFLGKLPEIEVLLVGEEFSKADKDKKFRVFNDITSLGQYLQQNTFSDTLILLKGSRAHQLEKLNGFL